MSRPDLSRSLPRTPVWIVVAGAGLAAAAGWLAFRFTGEGPQASDLIALSVRAVDAKSPRFTRSHSGADDAGPEKSVPTGSTSSSEIPGPPLIGLRPRPPLELPSGGMVVRDLSWADDGKLHVALAMPSVATGCGRRETRAGGEICSFDASGKLLARRPITDFAPQAILAAPGGVVYVAGQGKWTRFNAAGERLATVELFGNGDLFALTNQARANVPQHRQKTIDGMQKYLAGLDQAIVDAEGNAAAGGTKGDEAKKSLPKYRRSREQFAQAIAEAEKSTFDDDLAGYLDNARYVERITRIGDDLFLLTDDAVRRASTVRIERTVILMGSGNSFQDLRGAGGDLFVQGNMGLYERYDIEGRRLGTAAMGYDTAVANYLNRKSGIRLDLNGSFAMVGDGQIAMLDKYGSVLRWTLSGKFVGIVSEGNYEFSRALKPIVEASADGRRVYLAARGGTTIVPLSADE